MDAAHATNLDQQDHRYLLTEELRSCKTSRESFKSIERKPITVMLYGVGIHYNLGAIFRACDNFLICPPFRPTLLILDNIETKTITGVRIIT